MKSKDWIQEKLKELETEYHNLEKLFHRAVNECETNDYSYEPIKEQMNHLYDKVKLLKEILED